MRAVLGRLQNPQVLLYFCLLYLQDLSRGVFRASIQGRKILNKYEFGLLHSFLIAAYLSIFAPYGRIDLKFVFSRTSFVYTYLLIGKRFFTFGIFMKDLENTLSLY